MVGQAEQGGAGKDDVKPGVLQLAVEVKKKMLSKLNVVVVVVVHNKTQYQKRMIRQ